MAETKRKADAMLERTAYTLVRRAQAAIAGYRHFGPDDLCRFLERPAFEVVATKLAAKYFYRSTNLALYQAAINLYVLYLIVAPVLQRIRYSTKLDWHSGHILSWFRRYCAGRPGRVHVAVKEIPRIYAPDMLLANLEALGLHDGEFNALLLDQFRRGYGEPTVQGRLLNTLFDPLMMLAEREGFDLRLGNRYFRAEKEPFPGSSDLRRGFLPVGNYRVGVRNHASGQHLEIRISDERLHTFRQAIKEILKGKAEPAYKYRLVREEIRDFVEKTRFARSAEPEVVELKQWLQTKLRSLSGTDRKFKELPDFLVKSWFDRGDHRFYLSRPNFFLDHSTVPEEVFLTFFSPYREEV